MNTLTSVSASKILSANAVKFGRDATEEEKQKIYHTMMHHDICEHQISDELIFTHEIHKNPIKRVFKKLCYDMFAFAKMLRHEDLRRGTLEDYSVTYYPCDSEKLAEKMKGKFEKQIQKHQDKKDFEDVGQVQVSPTEIITYAR